MTYLNSGDWIENLTSLEYYDHGWHIYHYNDEEFKKAEVVGKSSKPELSVIKNEVDFFLISCIKNPIMKIFYSVQATGNGHISRAMELLPYLQEYGVVDIFLSGANSSLGFNAPIKYRSKGLSLYYTCKRKLDYTKTALSFLLFVSGKK